MEKTNKPPVPEQVYEDGILYYTIIDYHWIDPLSKEAAILKPGWLPIKQLNFDHPIMIADIKKLREECEEILARKNVDWDRLSRRYITI